MNRPLILAGMPGSGKTTVGRRLAEALGWAFVDLDAEIARAAGMPIAAIFAEEGEVGFRARERAAVAALAAGIAAAPAAGTVVATGGGTLAEAENRRLLASLGTLVCLTAPPEVLAQRLAGEEPGARPLLAPAGDPSALAALLHARQPLYDSLPWQVETGGRDPPAVADAVLALAGLAETLDLEALPVRAPDDPADPRGPRGGYAVLLGAGALDALGPLLRARGVGGRALVVSDGAVGPLYAARAVASLEGAGIPARPATMGRGEAAKSLGTVVRIYAAALEAGLDREGTIVALGGGVVGDTAGFAAASYLRGIRLVQVPTTLLAMVDAAIGGKTGVNLPAGKNLAGAFKQPALVLADPALLASLPERELRGGLAEVVKAALIGEPLLFEDLEQAGAPAPGDAAAWSGLVLRAARVKAGIVGADPVERGPRLWLNLGHTFAHALERAGNYRLPHGEAVAVGLVAAARLAAHLELLADPALPGRVEALLARLGLPTRWGGPAVEAVLEAMRPDKKRREGRLRFVLPVALGAVQVHEAVPEALVRAVLAETRL